MKTTERAFFEQLHADGDPWDLATDPYEQRRYDIVATHVEPGRYDTAFEPGCSVGELTARLAERCGHVDAIDIAERAVAQARARCAGLPNVSISQGALPDAIPKRQYDLIAFVEVGYYFSAEVLADLCGTLERLVRPGGRLLAAHWIGESADHVLSGHAVHTILQARLTGVMVTNEEHRDARRDGFVLGVWDYPTDERPTP